MDYSERIKIMLDRAIEEEKEICCEGGADIEVPQGSGCWNCAFAIALDKAIKEKRNQKSPEVNRN